MPQQQQQVIVVYERVPSYGGHIVLSVFACCCCYVLCGLVAFFFAGQLYNHENEKSFCLLALLIVYEYFDEYFFHKCAIRFLDSNVLLELLVFCLILFTTLIDCCVFHGKCMGQHRRIQGEQSGHGPHPVCQWDGTCPGCRQIFLQHKNGTQPSFCLFCLLSTSLNFRINP